MRLKMYLCKNRLSIRAFAYTVGCTPEYLSAYVNGRQKISARLAELISIITNRELSKKEILEDCLKRPHAKDLHKTEENI